MEQKQVAATYYCSLAVDQQRNWCLILLPNFQTCAVTSACVESHATHLLREKLSGGHG